MGWAPGQFHNQDQGMKTVIVMRKSTVLLPGNVVLLFEHEELLYAPLHVLI